MADTTFTDGVTVVQSSWLNDVNSATYRAQSALAGSTNRTSLSRNTDRVSVKDYGAAGDGVTDDTVAFQTAANTGKCILIPKGIYIINGTINLTVVGTQFIGDGVTSTTVYNNSLNAKIFNVTANDCEISHLSLDYNGTPTSGATAIYSTGANCRYHSFFVNRAYIGIALLTGPSQSARNFFVYNYVSIGVWLSAIGDAFVDSFVCDAITSANGANGGLRLENFVEAAHISNGDILNGVYSLVTAAASYVSGSRPAYCTFYSIFFDSAAQGCFVNNIVASTFTDCWFSGGRSGIGFDGCRLYTTDDISFLNTKFVSNGANGCFVQGASTRATFHNCKAQGNAVTTGAGTSAGLVFDVNCDQFQVIGGMYGNSFYGGSQAVGISISAGCTNYTISGANVRNNTSSGISNASTTTSGKVLDNQGWNPVGGSAITVGASPYTYTAGPSPETIYITQGTVSNITVAGFGMFSTTEKTVHLGPNETVQVTYSVLPTIRKSVH